MSGRRSSAGFTLIEVSVTVAVIGVVVLIAYGVFARVLEGKQIVEASAEESATARTVLGRLTRELRAATLATNARGSGAVRSPQGVPIGAPSVQPTDVDGNPIGFVSIDRTDASVPIDEIAFSTIVHRPASLAQSSRDLAVVHYFLRPEPGRPRRYVLFRESTPSLSGIEVDLAAPAVEASHPMLAGVTGLRLQFYDGEEWLEEWDSGEGRLAGRMPLGVRIWLALEAPDGVVATYHTAVDLPAAQRTDQSPRLVPPGGVAPGDVRAPGEGASS